MADKKIELVNVEVKSELTGKTVIKFQSERDSARSIAWDRLTDFLGVNRAVAALNYFVELN